MLSEKKLTNSWRPWVFEESQVESSEHQDNADIHYQPLPKSISEERKIYADYNGYHRHHVKHDSYLFAHFNTLRLRRLSVLECPASGHGSRRFLIGMPQAGLGGYRRKIQT
jgi:hypothetical protein